jgi:hypothetical protein
MAAIQAASPPPRQLARVSRPLQPAEIAVILGAARQAMADKTFTLSFPGRVEGPEVLMRQNGRLTRMRMSYGIAGGTVSSDGNRNKWHDDFIDVIDYTGAPARRCDGTAAGGELVITYEHRASTDKFTARTATTGVDWQGSPVEVGGPSFNILSGATLVWSDVVRQTSGGHASRALTAPFSRPPHSARNGYGLGDQPAAATQSLWIDADTLLPVRWEVAVGDRLGYELEFR